MHCMRWRLCTGGSAEAVRGAEATCGVALRAELGQLPPTRGCSTHRASADTCMRCCRSVTANAWWRERRCTLPALWRLQHGCLRLWIRSSAVGCVLCAVCL